MLHQKWMSQPQKCKFSEEVSKKLRNKFFSLWLPSKTLLLRQKPVELKRLLSPFWKLEISIMLLRMIGIYKKKLKLGNVKKKNFKCRKFTIKN